MTGAILLVGFFRRARTKELTFKRPAFQVCGRNGVRPRRLDVVVPATGVDRRVPVPAVVGGPIDERSEAGLEHQRADDGGKRHGSTCDDGQPAETSGRVSGK